MPTYCVSTYDPGETPIDEWGWTSRRTGLTLWQVREAIREFRSLGYSDDCSILVERED